MNGNEVPLWFKSSIWAVGKTIAIILAIVGLFIAFSETLSAKINDITTTRNKAINDLRTSCEQKFVEESYMDGKFLNVDTRLSNLKEKIDKNEVKLNNIAIDISCLRKDMAAMMDEIRKEINDVRKEMNDLRKELMQEIRNEDKK